MSNRLVLRLLLLLAFAPSASAAGPLWPQTDMPRFWILGEGSGHFSVDGTYFYSKENYDGSGIPFQPPQLDHVRYTNIRLHGAFGFTPRLSLFAQTDARGLFVSNNAGSNVSDDENYGFGDAFLGARWLAYRSRPTDRVYPTEWSPETWLALVEGSWVFPLYDRPKSGKPPLGDQSNDFTAMARAAWYANEWLALSTGVGYTYRTAGYADVIPWNLRADFMFLGYRKFRIWMEFKAQEGMSQDRNLNFNPKQADFLPGGSLLFKGYSPNQRMGVLGLGYRLGKEWEVSASGTITATGLNSAKGFGGTLGLVWRPYQIPEVSYEEYRLKQIERLRTQPRSYRLNPVVKYGFQATIVRVSGRGNFFRINFGRKDGVQPGDTFQVFEPDDLSNNVRRPVAFARVQVSREHESFLRVERRYDNDLQISAGYEVRRVILDEGSDEATFTWE